MVRHEFHSRERTIDNVRVVVSARDMIFVQNLETGQTALIHRFFAARGTYYSWKKMQQNFFAKKSLDFSNALHLAAVYGFPAQSTKRDISTIRTERVVE